MALRKIRVEGDEILRKVSKPVKVITPNVKIVIKDMIDTMYNADGVGLAAVQVGILKRIFVIDVGEGPIALINPEIVEKRGEQSGTEGCLSVPGKSGQVVRPEYVKIKAVNLDGEEFSMEGEGLFARAVCHEYDHLNGKLYVDMATDIIDDDDRDQVDENRDPKDEV